MNEYIIMGLLVIAVVFELLILTRKDKSIQLLTSMSNDLLTAQKQLKEEIVHSNDKNREIVMNSLIQNISQNDQKISQLIESNNKNSELLYKIVSDSLNRVSELIHNSTINEETKLEQIRKTLIESITNLQLENSKKLDEMRNVVDEKLQKTLEERIAKSFSLVNEQLVSVNKSVGEMQAIAIDVTDLKKVLSNVKTRGIVGEFQLSQILKQILSSEQYVENFKINNGSNDVVEFAIKFPGKDTSVYMPIDSKFPQESYLRLMDAYETNDKEIIKQSQKELRLALTKSAKDIFDKYIIPPLTTDFAILFLPTEGLFMEVLKLDGFIEELQVKYRINIAGPTNMAALLNSLQMGFKTLAISKKSDQIRQVLVKVLSEFDKFKELLIKTQHQIRQADTNLDSLLGVRTSKIYRELNKVESIESDDQNLIENE